MSGQGNQTLFAPRGNCPACAEQRVHTIEEWAFHPLAGHGRTESGATHPDLDPAAEEARES